MPYTVSILTLGCRVNQYESDSFAEDLAAQGITIVPFGEKCDLSVVNTCTVTAESDRKSRQMIRRAARDAKKVAVTGCFAQISPDAACALPNVVFVRGNGGKASLTQMIPRLLADEFTESVNGVLPPDDRSAVEMTVVTPMRTRSYVKIEDGCNNKCAYCIISTARGPVRSKDPETVLEEIRKLAENGCREVILTGIEVGAYNKIPLYELIEKVASVEGVKRLRLGSLSPNIITEQFLSRISKLDNFMPHIHLSIQSCCDSVLSNMKRAYRKADILEKVKMIKEHIPGCMLSADIIVGFPGETEEDFLETVDTLNQLGIFHVHSFPYSERPGTIAAELPCSVPKNERSERNSRLIAACGDLKSKILHAKINESSSVLVEKIVDGIAYGHTEQFLDACFDAKDNSVGDIVDIKIISHDGNLLNGVIV